jgi:hypothetical protein
MPERHESLRGIISQPGRWTATSWTPPAHQLTFDTWQEIGKKLRREYDRLDSQRSSILWYLADWLNWGEGTFGERYAQALDATDYHRRALGNIARIGRRFTPDMRCAPERVSFWTHAEVEKLPDDDALELLDRYADPEAYSEDGLYSRGELRAEVKARLKQ